MQCRLLFADNLSSQRGDNGRREVVSLPGEEVTAACKRQTLHLRAVGKVGGIDEVIVIAPDRVNAPRRQVVNGLEGHRGCWRRY